MAVALDEFHKVARQDEAAAVWRQDLGAAAEGTWRPGAAPVLALLRPADRPTPTLRELALPRRVRETAPRR